MKAYVTLTQRTARALSFRLVGSALDVGLSIALGVVLARILPPEEFGLFGVALSIVSIAEVFGSCGMLRALVQRKDLLPEHQSAALIFQLGGAFLLSLAFFFLAPVMGAWFRMPGLSLILQLQPLMLLLHAGSLLPEARLTRKLAFGQLTTVQAISRALGGGVSIVAAIQGWGALALVLGSVLTAALRMALLWLCAPGFVTLSFGWRQLRPLLSFGSAVSIINILNLLAQRLDVLIIGRLVGSGGVGLYQRAFQLALLPLGQITGPANKVLFPAMSSVQDEPDRFRRGYLATVRLSTFVSFPVLTLLWAISDIIVPFLYGPMWAEAVPILQVLCVAGVFRVLTNSHGLVAQAQGKAKAEAVQQFVWLLLVVVFGVIGSRAGALGVAIGVTVATVIFFICMTRLALPLATVSLSDWLKAVRSGLIGCVFTGGSILLIKAVVPEGLPTVLTIVLLSCLALCVYGVTLRFCRSEDDERLIVSVSRMLPPWLEDFLTVVLGINKGTSRQPQFQGDSTPRSIKG